MQNTATDYKERRIYHEKDRQKALAYLELISDACFLSKNVGTLRKDIW